MQFRSDIWPQEGSAFDLNFSAKKCAATKFAPEGAGASRTPLILQGNILKWVTKCKYLGVTSIAAHSYAQGPEVELCKKLNRVPPRVKSAETAELWFSCVSSNVNGGSPKNGSAVAAKILRFARRNRHLNVSGLRLPLLSLY